MGHSVGLGLGLPLDFVGMESGFRFMQGDVVGSGGHVP